MKSKKKLFAWLSLKHPDIFAGASLTHARVRDETYGKDSMIYLFWPDEAARQSAKVEMLSEGFKVSDGGEYWDSDGRMEVQVSYFRGWHWNE